MRTGCQSDDEDHNPDVVDIWHGIEWQYQEGKQQYGGLAGKVNGTPHLDKLGRDMSAVDATYARHGIDDDEGQYRCFQVNTMCFVEEVRCPKQEEPPHPVCNEA